MDISRKEAQKATNNYDCSDSEDEIPLAKLKASKTIDEGDQPLSALKGRPTGITREQIADKVTPGICEVRHCKEEVWAACVECLVLLCYDHFMEDVTSCEDHNMKGILRNSAQESPPGERSDSDR
ncbi:hypothetical protein ElyMa_005842300 [Elysia marginata]|uniref:B box-type domain-containing protein n=1 Tax=Elysia marginata TaxID=1093978 RepID=A0AAV4FXY1_9GAST|nr:hypothetical protein ElyMa_005842300 [Elysia marginata]